MGVDETKNAKYETVEFDLKTKTVHQKFVKKNLKSK
jgi:hypothetical protein